MSLLEHHRAFVSDSDDPIERIALPVNLRAEGEVANAVGHVEVAGRERLHVVDVNVIDGERLSGRDVKGPTNSIDLQRAVDLAAFAQGSLFGVGESSAVLTLLDAARVKLPIFLPVIHNRNLRPS